MEPLKTGRAVADLGTVGKDDRRNKARCGSSSSWILLLRRHMVKYGTVQDGESVIENAVFRGFHLGLYKALRTRVLLPSGERELNDLSQREPDQKSLRCNLSGGERFLLSDLRGY